MPIGELLSNDDRGLVTTGSARRLGAGHRLHSPRKQKTPKALENTDLFGTLLSRKILYKIGLTTCLTTYGN